MTDFGETGILSVALRSLREILNVQSLSQRRRDPQSPDAFKVGHTPFFGKPDAEVVGSRVIIAGVLAGLILAADVTVAADEGAPAPASTQNVVRVDIPAKEGGLVKVKEHKSGEWTPSLTEVERETVFAIALDSLEWCVTGGKGEFSFEKYQLTDKLKEPTHTFVTLKIRDMLRGCIGSLPPWPAKPLYQSVHDNAVNAALQDPRFRPVKPDELPKLEVHVSLLSPAKDIKSINEFNLGEHGIILEKGRARSVYLPEVAVEQGWTKEETLNSLSEKAGLPADAWKEGAKFRVYSSVVLERE